MKVYCVFRKYPDGEYSLWKVFDTIEKAETWLKEHGNWAEFVIEEWPVK